MQKWRWARVLILGAALVFSFPKNSRAEPANLSLLKDEIVQYIDSGRYQEEIAVVAKKASAWIEERVRNEARKDTTRATRLAVVFDIDETMLSNLPHMRAQDFGYHAGNWTAWLARGEAPVIEPVREVFRTARRLGVDVIFISGRKEMDRAGTEKNLRAVGVGDYQALILKADDAKETTGSFKIATRKRLTKEGFTIIANIGDQQSDLDGGNAERTFKLPDPFYLIK
jgi:acid phosphatase